VVVVTISSGLRARIFEQLQQAYPNEGGGFLLGVEQGESLIIRDVHPVANVFAAEEQYHRYAMTPTDWMRLEDEADAKGLTLVGYYHSHPDHPAQWSPTDFEEAHWLGCCYVITAVAQGKAAVTNSFFLAGQREEEKRFEQQTVEVTD